MKTKTRIYLISGALIIGILLLLLGINFITGQKNTKKLVKPIASSSDIALAEIPTTVVNTNKGISVSKTIKEISSSSARSISSKAKSSSSSSENSSSQVSSSSSSSSDSELDSRLQWKEDCKSITGSVNKDFVLQKTNLGNGKELIVAPCDFGANQGASIVYYYEVAPNGRWLSQRQIFWANATYLNAPKIESNVLTNIAKYNGAGSCGRIEKYELNLTTKMFDPVKIQEQECVPIDQNPSAIKDSSGELISFDRELWKIIYEKK